MSNTARMLYDVARSCFARMLASTRKFSFFFSFSRSRNEADRPKRENGKMGALRFCANAERQTERRRARTRNVVILCCVYSVLRVSSASRCARKRPRVFIFLLLGLFLSSLLFLQDNNNEGKKKQSPRRAPCILTIVFSYSFHKSLQEEEPLPALNTE